MDTKMVKQGGATVRFRAAKMTSGWKATYRKVNIDIFYDHKDHDSLGKPKGPKQFYFVLRRAGAPRTGPEASHPSVFLNSSCDWREKSYSTLLKAMRASIGAIHEGYPFHQRGMSRGEAFRLLDEQTQKLKDNLGRYAEMAGLTEEEYDRCISGLAGIFGRLRTAGMRLAAASHGSQIAPWKRGGRG